MPARPQCNRRPLAPRSPGRAPPGAHPLSPARPLAHRHLQRPVAGYDRHVGIRVGKLPLFHVTSFQRHLPAARRVRRALPAGGGKALGRCSGAPARAGPRRLCRPGRASPSQNSPLGGEFDATQKRSGFRSDLRPLTRMLWTGLPAAFVFVLFSFRFHLCSPPSWALSGGGGAPVCALWSLAGSCSWATFAAASFPEPPLG